MQLFSILLITFVFVIQNTKPPDYKLTSSEKLNRKYVHHKACILHKLGEQIKSYIF